MPFCTIYRCKNYISDTKNEKYRKTLDNMREIRYYISIVRKSDYKSRFY